MRYVMTLVLGLGFIFALIGATVHVSRAIAQTGTPVAVPPGAVDVTIEPLGTGRPVVAEGYDLSLLRVTFKPGGSIGTHTHPGSLVLTITEGALAYAIIEGEATIVRGGDPEATETLSAGQETVLNPGDALFEQGIVHTARNVSDEETVVFISGLMESEQRFTQFFDPASTP